MGDYQDDDPDPDPVVMELQHHVEQAIATALEVRGLGLKDKVWRVMGRAAGRVGPDDREVMLMISFDLVDPADHEEEEDDADEPVTLREATVADLEVIVAHRERRRDHEQREATIVTTIRDLLAASGKTTVGEVMTDEQLQAIYATVDE